jgi:hypothetical protein
LGALSGKHDTAEVKLSAVTKFFAEPERDHNHNIDISAPRISGNIHTDREGKLPDKAPGGFGISKTEHFFSALREPQARYETRPSISETKPLPDNPVDTAAGAAVQICTDSDVRVLGEALCTYILQNPGTA